MASLVGMDNVADLCPPRQNWMIKVRLIRLWTAPSFDGTDISSSLEMIFMDEQGGKIQASLRKGMYRRWADKFMEGLVYRITTCHLIPNFGSYRATEHAYRLLFTGKTAASRIDCSLIPTWGLTLKSTEDIHAEGIEKEYLVDVVGLVSAASKERCYQKEGKNTKILTLELTDDKGNVEFTVFGDYAYVVSEYLSSQTTVKPVVNVELAKVKEFRGKNVLQNVMNATRLTFNPEIPEIIAFKDVINRTLMDVDEPVGVIVIGQGVVPLIDDFIKNNPRKDIFALNETNEDDCFVVLAKVFCLLQDDSWWYNACRCHKGVTTTNGVHYCPGCLKNVVDVVPRYKVKLEVSDGVDSASLMMFDTDAQYLLKKSCKDMLAAVEEMEEILVGKELLFKVEKKSDYLYHYDGTFRVKRVCDDVDIIDVFKTFDSVQTPVMAKFNGPFPVIDVDAEDQQAITVRDQDVSLTPPMLTPDLGSDPSMIGSSTNAFKRKLPDEFDEETPVPKMKFKPVKIEKM